MINKKCRVKPIIIALCVTAVLAVVVYVLVLQVVKARGASRGEEMFSEASRKQIVATINGVPVSAFEVELKQFFSQKSLGKDEALQEIAMEMLVLERAKAAGITVSDDEIMEEIRSEEEYIKKEAENGNRNMVQRQRDDKELLTLLGMTKDEFNREVYAKMLLYSKTFQEYGKYYIMNNPGSSTSFEDYIHAEFNKANIVIVKKDIEEN